MLIQGSRGHPSKGIRSPRWPLKFRLRIYHLINCPDFLNMMMSGRQLTTVNTVSVLVSMKQEFSIDLEPPTYLDVVTTMLEEWRRLNKKQVFTFRSKVVTLFRICGVLDLPPTNSGVPSKVSGPPKKSGNQGRECELWVRGWESTRKQRLLDIFTYCPTNQ